MSTIQSQILSTAGTLEESIRVPIFTWIAVTPWSFWTEVPRAFCTIFLCPGSES